MAIKINKDLRTGMEVLEDWGKGYNRTVKLL
jgi:hypothetical protein